MTFVRARKTVGLGLMVSSLVMGTLMAPAAVAAESEVPKDLQQVDVAKQAYWNGDKAKYADNAATREFPPQAVCLVQPQACFFPEDGTLTGPDGETYEDPSGGELGGALNDGTAQVAATEQELLAQMYSAESGSEPADAVPPESHPVSIAFGQANYRSAIAFELPPMPEGEQVESFVMVLTEGQPTYSNESPAFRQAVLAALTCASESDNELGRCRQEEFEKVDPEELRDDSDLLVEACPITGDWEAGEAQDEDDLPEVDCLYTTSGTPVEVEGERVWVFDLQFTAQAWYDGTLEQKGLLLRPGSAENFAYGDAETTYSKQVTFDQPVKVAMATIPEPEPFAAPPPPPAPSSTGGFSGSNDAFATPSSSPSTGSSVPMPSTSTTTPQPTGDQAPAVSEPTAPQTAGGGEQAQTLAAGTPLGEPENSWLLWLLVPMFLAGAWLLSRSLEEQAVAATERSGAMTRLLERQQAARAPDLVTG